jgi:hypothetical protein
MSLSFDLNDANHIDALINMKESIDDSDKHFTDVLQTIINCDFSSENDAFNLKHKLNEGNGGYLGICSRRYGGEKVTMIPCIDTYVGENQKPAKHTCSSAPRPIINAVNKYNDYSKVSEHDLPRATYKNMRGRCQETYPTKLFKILARSDFDGFSSIISWLPHGRAFKIHNVMRFEQEIMGKYFFQSKFSSFKRQLYVYGFQQIGEGFADSGAYFHELFLRNRPDFCKHIVRCVTASTSASNHLLPSMIKTVPNFYKLPPLEEVVDSSSNESMLNSNSESSNLKSHALFEPKIVRYQISFGL